MGMKIEILSKMRSVGQAVGHLGSQPQVQDKTELIGDEVINDMHNR